MLTGSSLPAASSFSLTCRVAPVPRIRVVGPLLTLQTQRRTKLSWSKLNPFARKRKATDPLLGASASGLDDAANRQKLQQDMMQPGLDSSIFADEVTESGADKSTKPATGLPSHGPPVTPGQLAATQDPDPQNRQRWERKMVIRMIQRNGRESRREVIARTERQILHKSPFIATSVKKLVKVARQIAGKPLDDALLQMQFSKKKNAREVKYHLERARDTAVAVHGMGLGNATGNGSATDNGERKTVRTIETKDGKWLDVKDPTKMYVAEAWVNKGQWRGYRIVHMGRGRMSKHMKPSAGMLESADHAKLESIANPVDLQAYPLSSKRKRRELESTTRGWQRQAGGAHGCTIPTAQ
jgi:ribosomal protein L22